MSLIWSTSTVVSPVLPNTSIGYSMAYNTVSSTVTNAGFSVTGDAEFHGNIKWKGRDVMDYFKGIEERLAILVPDPKKLEHFEALQKAYQHYKMLEALCQLPNKEEK